MSGDMTTFFQGSSTQSTKVVGKSINPHYDSKMHFMGVTRDIFIATSVHAKILGELQLCRKLWRYELYDVNSKFIILKVESYENHERNQR